MRRVLILAALAASACGPAAPSGATVALSVDVARANTAIEIDGELKDPGGAPGHAVTVRDHYADGWDQAKMAEHPVRAFEGDTTLGEIVVPIGRCEALCADAGCTLDDVTFEWSQVQVDVDGQVLLGCARCEDKNGTKIAGDCPPPP
jgi:hypothetical protein